VVHTPPSHFTVVVQGQLYGFGVLRSRVGSPKGGGGSLNIFAWMVGMGALSRGLGLGVGVFLLALSRLIGISLLPTETAAS
jgi:hypothetical protein